MLDKNLEKNYDPYIAKVIHSPELEELIRREHKKIKKWVIIQAIEDGSQNLPDYRSTNKKASHSEQQIYYAALEVINKICTTLDQALTADSIEQFAIDSIRLSQVNHQGKLDDIVKQEQQFHLANTKRVLEFNLEKIKRFEKKLVEHQNQMKIAKAFLGGIEPEKGLFGYSRKGIVGEVICAFGEFPINSIALVHILEVPMIFGYGIGAILSAVCFMACHNTGWSLKMLHTNTSINHSFIEDELKEDGLDKEAKELEKKFYTKPHYWAIGLHTVAILGIIIALVYLRADEGAHPSAVIISIVFILVSVGISYIYADKDEKTIKHYFKHEAAAKRVYRKIDALKKKNIQIENKLGKKILDLSTNKGNVNVSNPARNIDIESKLTPELLEAIKKKLQIERRSLIVQCKAQLYWESIHTYRNYNIKARIDNGIELPEIWDSELHEEYLNAPDPDTLDSNNI